MKKQFLNLLILFSAVSVNAQWTQIPSGTTDKIDAIHFHNALEGYCTGGAVPIRRTTDGGNTWTSLLIAGGRDFSFAGTSAGYCASITGDAIRKTSNGGLTWTDLIPPNSNSLWSVATVNATTAYFGGTGGELWKTTNGTTITSLNSGTTNIITDVFFTSATTGYFVEQLGDIRKTTNGGTTWTTVYSFPTGLATEMHFVNSNVGFVVGSAGQVVKTTDAGATWTMLTTNSTASILGVHFYDVNHGIVVGSGGTILYTNNGGTSWNPQISGTTSSLYDVRMLSPTSAVVVGYNGTILKNSGITVGLDDVHAMPEISCYPNPVADILTIKASYENYKLELSDMLGKILYTGEIEANEEFSLDLSCFPSGVYNLCFYSRERFVKKIIKQ